MRKPNKNKQANNLKKYPLGGNLDKGVNAIPYVGIFKSIGEGISGAVAPKDEYGVKKGNDFSVGVSSFFDPAEQTQNAFKDITTGKISKRTGINILAPFIGGVLDNKDARRKAAEMRKKQEMVQLAEEDFMKQGVPSNYNVPTFGKGGGIYGKVKRIPKKPEGGTIETEAEMNVKKYGYAPDSHIWKNIDADPQTAAGSYYSYIPQADRNKFLTDFNNRYATRVGGYYKTDAPGLEFIKGSWTTPANPPVPKYNVHAGEGFTGVSSSPYLKAKGGYVEYGQAPTAELEQGEPYRMPNGQIGMVSNNAPTHAEGGVPMALPYGTEILGKNPAGNGEMFKTIGQRLKKAQDRYDKVLKSRPTEIAKRTAKMMMDKVQTEYNSLFEEQEAQKQYLDQEQFARGGTYNPAQDQYEEETAYGAGQDQNYGMSKFSNAMGTIGEYAPIAYNLATGLKKPNQLKASDYYNPYESASLDILKNQKYDVNPELTGNRNQSIAYNKAARNLGLSGGQTAAALASGNIGRMRADSDAFSRANQVNAGYRSQYANALGIYGQQRASTKLAIEDINTREKAAREGTLQAGLSQLSQVSQANKLRNNMILRDAQKMGLLDSLVQNYTLDSKGKWVSRSTGKTASQDEILKFIKG